ncbi:unnamed protein product [Bemisia tabaci]|uniref:Strictosidine synthase conserved region domain-containing protein n=1 Tax=Bemisia tabaci TaxID=7038 RepID=A0A9P0A256_BEMTA|nr:unnamed protein product [Bemisia tabaci]
MTRGKEGSSLDSFATAVISLILIIAALFIIYKVVRGVYCVLCLVLRVLFQQKFHIFFLLLATVPLLLQNFGPPYFEFDSYSVEPALPLEGPLSINDALNEGEKLFKGQIKGPESLVAHKGILYAGLATGEIIAVQDDNWWVVADLLQPCRGAWDLDNCGRPLGLAFDKEGFLWVADAYYGIYKVDVKSKKQAYKLVVPTNKKIKTNESLEEYPLLPNSITIGTDGSLYWSDSSTNVPLHNLVVSVLGDKSGRLIKTNPKTGESTVLMSGLRFANGVLLAPDESYILVAETFLFRVHRYWLKGPNKGKSEVFIDRLPGAPDNLSPTEDGGFIINLIQPRSAALDTLAAWKSVRRFIAAVLCLADLMFQKIDERYPNDFNKNMMASIGHYSSIAPFMARHSIAVFCDKNGKILKSLHARGDIAAVSDVVTLNGYHYLGSPHNDFLGRVRVR